MIDLHSHVLPGVDDGAADLEESLSILESAAAEGVTAIAATPHVREDYRTTPDKMERALAELRAAANGIGVDVLAGGELALHAAATLDDATLARFGLGGSRAILVESP